MIKKINGDRLHSYIVKNVAPKLSFDENCDYNEWREKIKSKLTELLGLDIIAENACPTNIDIEETVEFDTYTRIRLTYESEKENLVPAYLLLPKKEGKFPLAIALQGHSTGFHISIGEKKFDVDEKSIESSTFGLQAVENGFAVLCIEQRGMGETRSPLYPGPGGVHACCFTAMTAVNLGRTVIGERVWDVSRGIDALETLAYDCIDLSKIVILGNSGGGTATFYAGCCDERIGIVAPACSFCSYEASIMSNLHCVCNNIPQASRWFEMEDLSCLIAPRRLAVLTGRLDDIFPLAGVEKSYETVKKIYAKAGVPDNCSITVMPKAHYWCKDEAWETINNVKNQLGW